ncbi:MAG: hypothetical protein GX902_06005 [Lentisphaerae bacterium]|nr:hypothetical protein [Lentisphaerota bacterium]
MLKKLLTLLTISALGTVIAQEATPAAPAEAAKPAEVAQPAEVTQPAEASQTAVPRQQRNRGGQRNFNRGGAGDNKDLFVERMQSVSAKLIAKYDADADGVLNDTEKAALQKDLKTVEEFMEIANIFQIRQLQAADLDGDFILSEEEIEKLDMQKIRQSVMPRNRQLPPGRREPGPNRPNRPPRVPVAPDAPAAK